MQHVLEVAGLDDGDYTIEEFIERINQIEYDPDRDGEISLFVNVAKLLFVEFAGTTESNDKIGLANVRKVSETQEEIDLVDRALPEPKIEGLLGDHEHN